MKDTGYNKTKEKLKEYGLSPVSIYNVMECVSAYQNLERLPQATLDSIQAISDIYDVCFTYTTLKRKRIALTGIGNNLRATYLYTDETLKDRDIKKHWLKNPVQYTLYPGSDNKLVKDRVLRKNQSRCSSKS